MKGAVDWWSSSFGTVPPGLGSMQGSFASCAIDHDSLPTCGMLRLQLLEHGEIYPGLTAAEFAMRREALADAMPADSVALLPAPPLKYRAGVVPYPYRAVGGHLPCRQPRCSKGGTCPMSQYAGKPGHYTSASPRQQSPQAPVVM
jgi:Aminopeptidase P, N-terminal domain